MDVIWLIEDHKKFGRSLAQILMGNFAVRLFGSLKSFQQLLKIEKKYKPNILIIDSELIDGDICLCDSTLSCELEDIPRIYLIRDDQKSLLTCSTSISTAKSPVLFSLGELGDIEVAAKIRSFLEESYSSSRQNNIFKYRDICLDAEKNVVGTLPETPDKIDLTLTESRILRLLILNQGRCLSRESIRRYVWNGAKVSPRTIDSHVSRLRKHLLNAESTIESVYGGGYLLR